MKLFCYAAYVDWVMFFECSCAKGIEPWPIEEEKKMRTTIVKGCLYCGLGLPENAEFCPECGRSLEEVVNRVDTEGQMMRTIHAKECLYCGLRFPDSMDFCPDCGRQLKEVA